MVMLQDAPEEFTADLSLYNPKLAKITIRGQKFRAQLPSYQAQQRAMVVTNCPLPKVLQCLVADYTVTTPEDMWTVGLRVGAPRAKRVRDPKAKHFEEEVEEDEEVAPSLRRSQRLRKKRG
jgi:hypothetical protein